MRKPCRPKLVWENGMRKMGENQHDRGDNGYGSWRIKGNKEFVHSNFTSRSLMHGGIGAGQLRMDLLGDKIFSTNGIKGKTKGFLKLRGKKVYSSAIQPNGRDSSVKSRAIIGLLKHRAHAAMKETQRGVGFALNTLTQLAQAVTSRNDSLAILECTQCDLTA
ncbi:hypothetical protein Tco_0912333 [Tanacetum coccineum]